MFSDDLTQARKRERLSRLDLARETGVSYSHIANLERGGRLPSLEILHKLDKRLHFPARTLIALIRTPQSTLRVLQHLSAAVIGAVLV